MSNSLHMVAGSDRCREMQRRRMACTAFFPAATRYSTPYYDMPCFWWHETQSQGLCTHHVVPLKTNSLQSDLRASKITTFVLLRLPVSWRCSQKLASASSCRWSPSGLVDIRMRSSAYSNNGTKMPPSSGASMPAVSNYISGHRLPMCSAMLAYDRSFRSFIH